MAKYSLRRNFYGQTWPAFVFISSHQGKYTPKQVETLLQTFLRYLLFVPSFIGSQEKSYWAKKVQILVFNTNSGQTDFILCSNSHFRNILTGIYVWILLFWPHFMFSIVFWLFFLTWFYVYRNIWFKYWYWIWIRWNGMYYYECYWILQ